MEWQKRRKRLNSSAFPSADFKIHGCGDFEIPEAIHWICTEGVSDLSDPRSSQAVARVVFDQLSPSGHAHGSCVQIMCTVDMCTQVYRSCVHCTGRVHKQSALSSEIYKDKNTAKEIYQIYLNLFVNEVANTENEPLGSGEGICQKVCFARHERHPTLTAHKILRSDLDTKFQAFPEQPHKSKCLYQLPEPSPPCYGQPHVSAFSN